MAVNDDSGWDGLMDQSTAYPGRDSGKDPAGKKRGGGGGVTQGIKDLAQGKDDGSAMSQILRPFRKGKRSNSSGR
jgi:hypothetical protein